MIKTKKDLTIILITISLIVIIFMASATNSPVQMHTPEEIKYFKNFSNNTGIFINENAEIIFERDIEMFDYSKYYLEVKGNIASKDLNTTITCCNPTRTACITNSTLNLSETRISCNQYPLYPLKITVRPASPGFVIWVEGKLKTTSILVNKSGESYTSIWR